MHVPVTIHHVRGAAPRATSLKRLPHKGPPLKFMVDPYAEVDGKPAAAKRRVKWREE